MNKDTLLLEFEEWDMEKWQPLVNLISASVHHYERSGKCFTFNMYEKGSRGFSIFLKVPTHYSGGILSVHFKGEKVGGSDVEIFGKTTNPLEELQRKIKFYLKVKMSDLSDGDIEFLTKFNLYVKPVEMAVFI